MTLPLILMGVQAANHTFGSPTRVTMREAIARALDTGPAIATARHRVAAARAEVGMARGMRSVHITGGVLAGAAGNETMVESPSAAPAPSAMLGRQASLSLAATAMAPIDTGGALESELHRAKAMLAMAEAEFDGARSRTVAEVKEAYLRGRFAAAMLAVAEADRKAARAMAGNSKADWEAGRGIEAGYLRAIARLRAADRDVANAEAERAKAGAMLARAIGLKSGDLVEASEDPQMDRPFVSLDEAIAVCLQGSPMVRATQRGLDAARQGQRAAAAAQRPQVYMSLMGALSTPRTMSGSGAAVLGLSATMPIADGGVRKLAKAKADAETRAADEQVRAATLEVEAEVRMAWSDLVAAEASLAAAKAASEAAMAAYAVVELRVRAQKSILVEQLDALTAVREAEAAIAQARLNYGLAVTRIERLVGKG